MPEKYFTPNDIPHLKVDTGGVYVIANSQPDINLQLAGELANGDPIWWQKAGEEQMRTAIELRDNPLVHGIGILAVRETSEDALPLSFASYLTELRARNKGMSLPCVVSAEPPETPSDYVRLPHMVAYSPDKTKVTDKAMWEVLPGSEAEQWLSGSLPNQQFIESHLPQLLQLRAAYRTHQLPDTRYHKELAHLLDQGRYLSVLFVYQHFSLFEALLQEEPLV